MRCPTQKVLYSPQIEHFAIPKILGWPRHCLLQLLCLWSVDQTTPCRALNRDGHTSCGFGQFSIMLRLCGIKCGKCKNRKSSLLQRVLKFREGTWLWSSISSGESSIENTTNFCFWDRRRECLCDKWKTCLFQLKKRKKTLITELVCVAEGKESEHCHCKEANSAVKLNLVRFVKLNLVLSYILRRV